MTMRKFIFGVSFIVMMAGTLWSRGIEAPSTLVVLPARQRVVEFGFDLICQQGITLISYQQVGPDLLVHLWNGREWVPMTSAAYFSGTFLLGAPEQLVLVGDDTLLPAMFQTVPDWSRKTTRIRALDISSLVNQFGTLLKFNDREWKWFAEKYGLALTDSNASRRRWGKYGPPGNEWYRQQPPPKGELRPVSLPSAVVPVVAPSEPVQSTIPPVNVIPDNAPAVVPVTLIEATPVVATPAAPAVTPPVVPATEAVTPAEVPVAVAPAVAVPPASAPAIPVAPAMPTPPAAIAPAVPAAPVAPVVTTPDVLPPGTTVELPGK